VTREWIASNQLPDFRTEY